MFKSISFNSHIFIWFSISICIYYLICSKIWIWRRISWICFKIMI